MKSTIQSALLLFACWAHGLSSSPTFSPRLQKAADEGLLVQPLPNLYVLGTVHIGSESAIEAEELIKTVQPDTVVVEVSPSRLQSLKRQAAIATPKATDPVSAIFSLPSFADRGWSSGGFLGLVFCATVLWPSFVKRSFTVNEEEKELPRRDEFAAAVQAALEVNATVVAADSELDDLILEASRGPTLVDWIQLAYREGIETNLLGLRSKDPIRRRPNESLQAWAKRRRNPETARASKQHGEEINRAFSKLVVDDRDDRFSQEVRAALEQEQTVVCVAGLVHVDGICDRLLN